MFGWHERQLSEAGSAMHDDCMISIIVPSTTTAAWTKTSALVFSGLTVCLELSAAATGRSIEWVCNQPSTDTACWNVTASWSFQQRQEFTRSWANMHKRNLHLRLQRKWRRTGRAHCGTLLQNASVCVVPDLPLPVLFRYCLIRLRLWMFRRQDSQSRIVPLKQPL